MMTTLTALEEALWVASHRENYTKQQKYDAAASLSEWGLFSLRQVAAITGISHSTVRGLARSKTDKTGGRFDPACLEALQEIRLRRARGESVEPADVYEMIRAGSGTSVGFAARLSGIPEGWLRRRIDKAKGEGDGGGEEEALR